MDPQQIEQGLQQLALAMVAEQPKGEELLVFMTVAQPWSELAKSDYMLAS